MDSVIINWNPYRMIGIEYFLDNCSTVAAKGKQNPSFPLNATARGQYFILLLDSC